MSKRVGAMNFEQVSMQMLREYGDQVVKELMEIVPDAADTAVKMIRQDSRKRTGKYARGWAKKCVAKRFLGSTWVVYNRDRYRITHLLENGHKIRNKYGEYGTTKGDSVIWFTQEYLDEWIESELIKRLE